VHPHNLLTLGAILKAEPLKPPSPQRTLSDLLRETQDDDDIATLFVSLDQQNQQSSSSVFLSQQTSEQYFQPQ
jgi:hypothetical protein